MCVRVCVVALSSRALVDKWPNGIDFNLENAALHFSLYKNVGTWGGSRAALPEETYYWGPQAPVWGIYCTPRQAHIHSEPTHTLTHMEKKRARSVKGLLHMSRQTFWSVRNEPHTLSLLKYLHDKVTTTTKAWRSATGSYVTGTSSLSHFTRFKTLHFSPRVKPGVNSRGKVTQI